MTDTKWTPGPWQVFGPDDAPNPNVGLWQVESELMNIANHITRADAHLIAAAPELYGALERAVEIIHEHVPEDALGQGGGICPEPGMPDQTWPIKEEELHYMDTALAKARGEDQ